MVYSYMIFQKNQKTIFPVKKSFQETPSAPSTYPNNDDANKRSILAGLLTGTVIAKPPVKTREKSKLPNAVVSCSNSQHQNTTEPSIPKQKCYFTIQPPITSIEKAMAPASDLFSIFCIICKKVKAKVFFDVYA